MCENKAVLYGKMSQVMGKLSRIKQTGKHQQGWKYATSEDVKDAVRMAMADVGLALLVSLEDYEVIGLDKGVIIRGKMAFTLCCSETGATETRHLTGEAADQAKVSDKAFYKLYTTLEKYYLKTTFLISSGDGEELDSDADTPPSLQKNRNNEMTLAKLLANLNRVERIKGFYTEISIMDCRGRGSEPPAPDDMDGWRVLFVDARDHAFEALDRAIEDGKISNSDSGFGQVEPGHGFVTDHGGSEPQSGMDEVEMDEDAQMSADAGQTDAHGPDMHSDETAPF